jgi:alpha-glucuronidase
MAAVSNFGDNVNWTGSILGAKTPLFAPFIYKMYHYTKTGSGQT